ncbi:hypothetical protein KAR91_62545 [Candidatus Pacearchaeota archaeon]|nr:hypothetical protein [Candidatus Pacearchaeota archaeon]
MNSKDHGVNRIKIPQIRKGLTKRVDACGFTYYLTVNFVDDKPVELFVTVAKEGSAVSGFIEAFAITMSIALQYGTPWEILHDKYIHQIFEPKDDKNSSLIHSISTEMDGLIKKWGIQ